MMAATESPGFPVGATPRLLSINVGLPKAVDTGSRVVETAIWKQPVAPAPSART